MSGPLTFLVGALVAFGVLAVVLGLLGVETPRPSGKGATASAGSDEADGLYPRKALAGLAGAVLAFAPTQWPMMAVWGFVAGWLVIVVRENNRERQRQFAVADGLVDWVEALRSSVEAGAGLQRAIELSAGRTHEAIRPDVERLAADMKSGDFGAAMRAFAVRMAHPSVDSIAAILLLVHRRGGRPQQELRALSRELAAQLRVWHAIEGGKRKVYAQAKTIGIVCSLVIGYLVFFRSKFVEPYDSLIGGTVGLGVVGALFLLGAWRIYQLGAWQGLDRPLRSIERAPGSRHTSAGAL